MERKTREYVFSRPALTAAGRTTAYGDREWIGNLCRDNLHGSGVAREKSVQDENAGGKESSEGETTMVTETKDKEENVVKVENIGGKK
jgi:hypothetical protein